MKPVVTIVLACFAYTVSVGQGCDCFGDRDKRDQLGVNVFSWVSNPNGVYMDAEYRLHQEVATGLMYKRHYGKNMLRIGGDYYSMVDEHAGITDLCTTCPRNDGLYEGVFARIGMQRWIGSKKTKLQPYMGLDAVVHYGTYSGTHYTGFDDIGYTPNNYEYTNIAAGVGPTLGINYRFIERLSVSLESSANIMYYDNGGFEDSQLNPSKGPKFNPIRAFTLNYHFSTKPPKSVKGSY